MSEPRAPDPTPEDPIDGGNRPDPGDAGRPGEADQPVGDFGDEERADPGGDSDVDPAPEGEER